MVLERTVPVGWLHNESPRENLTYPSGLGFFIPLEQESIFLCTQ